MRQKSNSSAVVHRYKSNAENSEGRRVFTHNSTEGMCQGHGFATFGICVARRTLPIKLSNHIDLSVNRISRPKTELLHRKQCHASKEYGSQYEK